MSFIIKLGLPRRVLTGSSVTRAQLGGLQLKFSQHQVNLCGRRTVKTSTVDWKPIKSSTTNLAKAEHQQKHTKVRYFFLSLMIAMPVVSFALGCWQVKRLDWKTELITRCENSLSLPPLNVLPEDLDPKTVEQLEYRKIKIKGHFDYDQEMFLGPRKRGDGDLGYLLVCPFVPSDGGKPILIERGWVSKDKIIPSTRNEGYLSHLALPQGEIEIVAMIRIMPPRSYLQYPHEEGSRQFFVPDVEAMAKQSGALPVYAQALFDLSDHPEFRRSAKNSAAKDVAGKGWFFSKKAQPNSTNEDSDEYLSSIHDDKDTTLEYQQFEFVNEGVPIGTIPKVNFKNNHMQYLVTWFALSFFSTGLLIYSLAKGRATSAEKVIAAKRSHMKSLE